MNTQNEWMNTVCDRYISREGLYKMICEQAYLKAKARGFCGGSELQDWMDAEKELAQRFFYWFCDG